MREKIFTNPFRPGNGIEPPYLAGRDEELNWFERSLDAALTLPRNLVVSGLRGTGKTVLLKEFEKICQKKKWLFVQREFDERYCNEQEFIGALITDVVGRIKGMPRLGKLAKRKIGFVAEEASLDEDFLAYLLSRYSGPLVDRLESILKDLYLAFIESGFHGLVLLYDEFHSVKDKKIPNNFPLSILLEAIGHTQREGFRYYLVLSGLPPLFPNLVEAKTYAERMFSVKELYSLSKDATKAAITKPLKTMHYLFSNDLADRLVEETRGYPYFVQFYGHYLIDIVAKPRITLGDYEKVHSLLLRELDSSFFFGRFERASDSERNVLLAMACLPGSLTTAKICEEVEKVNSKITYDSLRTLLKRLEEKNLIYKRRRGTYDFALPLFGEFVLRWTRRNRNK